MTLQVAALIAVVGSFFLAEALKERELRARRAVAGAEAAPPLGP